MSQTIHADPGHRWALVVGALALAAALCSPACGDTSGSPIVRLAENGGSPGSGGSNSSWGGSGAWDASAAQPNSSWPGHAADGGAGTGGSSPDASSTVSGGLCSPCQSKGDCGDQNDYCLVNGDESFCGRDCIEQGGCPDGYACVASSSGDVIQCAPLSGSCTDPFNTTNGATSIGSMSDQVLSQLNSARSKNHLSPLQLSRCLNSVAQAAAVEFAQNDYPHTKFDSECKTILPDCACGWEGELQVAQDGSGAWSGRVDKGVVAMLAEPDAETTVLSDRYTRVGIGFVVAPSNMWISVDLAP